MTCKDCRFYKCNECLKYKNTTNENYSACKDFADKKVMNEKLKLYD